MKASERWPEPPVFLLLLERAHVDGLVELWKHARTSTWRSSTKPRKRAGDAPCPVATYQLSTDEVVRTISAGKILPHVVFGHRHRQRHAVTAGCAVIFSVRIAVRIAHNRYHSSPGWFCDLRISEDLSLRVLDPCTVGNRHSEPPPVPGRCGKTPMKIMSPLETLSVRGEKRRGTILA